ncbi:hypothetical protein PR048_009526 [Dryococelus australis]|uniref:Uncharacterized protein n=1 Tax=Dryococelus australis TaxID=614101 RepID=A0ABQ9I174_9NEOP|nr:hypothetical protein PR048_009526 [Dryococelus australis]
MLRVLCAYLRITYVQYRSSLNLIGPVKYHTIFHEDKRPITGRNTPGVHTYIYMLQLTSSEATVAERLDCSPLTNSKRVQSPAHSPRFFASGNRAGRCRWSAGFLGDLPFPGHFHTGSQDLDHQTQSCARLTSGAGRQLVWHVLRSLFTNSEGSTLGNQYRSSVELTSIDVPSPIAGKLDGKKFCYCGKIFCKNCHACQHERTACTTSPFRTIKHYEIGPKHFAQGDTLKEHTEIGKHSFTRSQKVMSLISHAASVGTDSSGDNDETVNAKDGMSTVETACVECTHLQDVREVKMIYYFSHRTKKDAWICSPYIPPEPEMSRDQQPITSEQCDIINSNSKQLGRTVHLVDNEAIRDEGSSSEVQERGRNRPWSVLLRVEGKCRNWSNVPRHRRQAPVPGAVSPASAFPFY